MNFLKPPGFTAPHPKMQTIIIALLALIAVVLLFLVYISVRRQGGDTRSMESRYESLRTELRDSIGSNNTLLTAQLSALTGQVNGQLSTLSMQMHSVTSQIGSRMDNSARAVSEVSHHLGELSKATGRIFEIGRDIAGLNEIFRAPKLRGGIGEFFLADILAQCLPAAHYGLQYGFKNGSRCDAVIRLKGGLLPVDSKFPLDNFKRSMEPSTDEERRAARRRFFADCRKHIDSIASSYIRPEEGTLNFALMYIPAENVYYETIIKDADAGGETLATYAFSKRVVPVSPNSFYAYMQTIIMGLKGMEIGEKAMHMLSHLDGLKNEFDRFTTDLDTLGRHINNSRAKYEEVQRKAARFNDRLTELKEEDGENLQIAESAEQGK